jgi:hypothetical protein
VLSLYEISDSVTLGLNSDLKSKVINIQHLTPVKILLSAAFAVIADVPGGADPRAKGEGEVRRGNG